jgi:hypothetical protein
MVRFCGEIIFVVGFWWLWDILSTSLTSLVYPKSLMEDRLGDQRGGGGEWELIKILLEGDQNSDKTN